MSEQRLAHYGMDNAAAVVAAAEATGVPLWIAAAVIEKETNGSNIYGNDRGGVYSTTDPARPEPNAVTEENFLAFAARVAAGATSNGVGPAQITWPGYLTDARSRGIRLWDPLENITYGMNLIATYLGGSESDDSIRYAGRRYNGAAAYGEHLLLRARVWRDRLNLQEEDMTETSFNGFTTLSGYPPESGVFYAPNGTYKKVYTRNRAMAVVFAAAARRWDDFIEDIAKSHPDNWARPRERNGTTKNGVWDAIGIHCYRPPNTKVGTGNRSNHRSATAMDINGHLHPYEASMSTPWYSGFNAAQTRALRQIVSDFTDAQGRTILRLGIDFSVGKRDGMHIEIAPGVVQSRVNSAAKKLEDYVGRHSTADVWWRNAYGRDVEDFQRELTAKGFEVRWIDGKAGADTDRVIKEFQRAAGVTVDGRVGAGTRSALRAYKKPVTPPTPPPAPAPEPVPDPTPEPPVETQGPDDPHLVGPNRYASAALGALRRFPDGAGVVYLVEAQDSIADAVVAAGMTDGPILYVRRDGFIPSPTRGAIMALSPTEIIPTGALSLPALDEARSIAGLA